MYTKLWEAIIHNPLITKDNFRDCSTPHEPDGQDYLVAKYHNPRVAVIIPHHNYSDCIGEALVSVQQQSHGNFTCLIVDDCSDDAQFRAVQAEVAGLADSRFKLVRNAENLGQILSAYRGIDEIDEDFVAILDPDDRYTPHFLKRMLALHLNPLIFCPLVCCDEFLLRIGGGITGATYKTDGLDLLQTETGAAEKLTFQEHGFHRYFAPTEPGWHWTSTSAMVFRTAALKLLKPQKRLAYKRSVDAYCAYGAHMLGGSIFLREPLVYRGMHGANSYLDDGLFSMFKNKAKRSFVNVSTIARFDAVEAFLANGGMDLFDRGNVSVVIQAQFSGPELAQLIAAVPQVREILVGRG